MGKACEALVADLPEVIGNIDGYFEPNVACSKDLHVRRHRCVCVCVCVCVFACRVLEFCAVGRAVCESFLLCRFTSAADVRGGSV